MNSPLKLSAISIVALTLLACGRQDSETAASSHLEPAAVDPASTSIRSEPGELPTPLASVSAADADGESRARAVAERERLREQRAGEHHWWNDPALSERLSLQPEQRAALLQAHANLRNARLEERSLLQEQQARGSRPNHADAAARARLEAAEQAWQTALREILTPNQLKQLRADPPGNITLSTRD